MATLIDTAPGVGGTINRNASAAVQTKQAANPVIVPQSAQQSLSNPQDLGTYTAPSAITSTSLAPTQSIQVTQPQPSTSADGLSAQIGSGAENYFANYDKLVAQDSQGLAPLQRQIQSLIASPGQTQLTDQAYKSGGVDQAQADLRDINQQILESQRAQKAELDSLGKTGALTPAQYNAQRDAINRKYVSEQADLAVIQLSKQGKYDSAKQIADRAVSALLEGQKNKLDALQFTYTANKDLFDKKEQRAFELAQAQRQRDYANQDYMLRAKFDATIKQNDPLYQAQLANEYQKLSDTSGDADVLAYTTALQNGSATLAQVPQKLRGQVLKAVQDTGTNKLMGLLTQYRDTVNGLNFWTANLPNNKALLDTLKGQITATYKQQQQLGTLDNGVQTLVDKIIPDPSKLSISSLDNKAQVAAIDNFMANQKGPMSSATPSQQTRYTANGKTYVQHEDGLYYPE